MDPRDIPGGYSLRKHAALSSTIAEPGSARGLGDGVRMMACHETGIGAELPCVGWLMNQLGPGNNLPLRLLVMHGRVDAAVEAVGPQHERLDDTLPRPVARRRRIGYTSAMDPNEKPTEAPLPDTKPGKAPIIDPPDTGATKPDPIIDPPHPG